MGYSAKDTSSKIVGSLCRKLPMSRTRSTRKVSDQDLIRLNSLGYSLSTIAQRLGCHPTTVTLRLQALGIAPADTRHAFMEDVLDRLGDAQVAWLESILGPHHSVKDFVTSLILKEYLKSHGNQSKPGN